MPIGCCVVGERGFVVDAEWLSFDDAPSSSV